MKTSRVGASVKIGEDEENAGEEITDAGRVKEAIEMVE